MGDAEGVAHLLGALVIGGASGIASGLLGVSPGGILVPLLSIFLGLSQLQTQGISLAAQVLPTSVAGLPAYRRIGHATPLRSILYISAGFLAGSYFGARGAQHIPDAWLRWMFVAYLLVLAALVAFKRSDTSLPDGPASPPPPEVPAPALLVVGAVAGLSSGLLGIGGGLAITALLTAWLSLTQHQAQAFSLAVNALPLTLPAVLVYASASDGLPWWTVALVVAGLWIGTAAGAGIAVRMNATVLRNSFLLLVLAMAAAMAYRAQYPA